MELLKKKAADLAQLSYEQVVFYVADRDQAVLKDICEAYGKPCEGKCDADILPVSYTHLDVYKRQA